MFKKFLQSVISQKEEDRRAELYRNLMRHEAKIGGQLFGPVSPGGRREFFCLDEHTWIWHEEWIDKQGKRQVKTTRYDVRPTTILKAQEGMPYQEVTPKEAARLYEAAKIYRDRIAKEIYSFV